MFCSRKQQVEIIHNTYEYALTAGDKKVFFIDGKTLYPKDLYEHCSVDGIHPTDLGFYFFAKRLYKVIKGLL